MSSSKKDKIKVLSADRFGVCPRCGACLSINIDFDFFSSDFGKLIASCPNDSFKTHLEASKYGFIPEGYLQNIEKGLLDISEGWHERWILKETKNVWILKERK